MLAYQQMYFLTIDLKSNGVELLITFVTLIVNKKVIPCLCHFICLELFQIVMRLEICWLGHHIKYWLVNHINKCFFIDRLTSTWISKYSLLIFKCHKSIFKNVINEKIIKWFYFLPAFYLIRCFMKAQKNF